MIKLRTMSSNYFVICKVKTIKQTSPLEFYNSLCINSPKSSVKQYLNGILTKMFKNNT